MKTMSDYFNQPARHCTACGHWGRSVHSPEAPCAATGGTLYGCGCTDSAASRLDTPEAFRARYGLDA